MNKIIENEALKIDTTGDGFYTKEASEVYKYLNQKDFQNIKTISTFKSVLDILYKEFGFQNNNTYIPVKKLKGRAPNKKIVVAFSGGLDSVYQSLVLKEHGYDVYMLHITNLNAYTNGQEKKAAEAFAEYSGIPLHEISFTAKQHGEYKKIWQENPFKDFLIYSVCIDYMIENDIFCISCGDDLRLSIKDAVKETNISDSKELTNAFFNSLKNDLDFKFIPVNANIKKDMRLKYVRDNGYIDYYYSCVTAGRLNEYLHNLNQKKFNISLEKHNCGNCRKCAFHSLADYYYNGINFPDSYIKHCWDKISFGADNIFFDKSIPLEIRISNLRDY